MADRAFSLSMVQAVTGYLPHLLLAGLLLHAGPATAQDYLIRDADGRGSGTLEQTGNDRYILRDPAGRRTGTIEKSVGDRLILRNAQGARVGTVEPGATNELRIRNPQGRRIGTVEPRAAAHSPSGTGPAIGSAR